MITVAQNVWVKRGQTATTEGGTAAVRFRLRGWGKSGAHVSSSQPWVEAVSAAESPQLTCVYPVNTSGLVVTLLTGEMALQNPDFWCLLEKKKKVLATPGPLFYW